jgi:hypothetical protein
VPDLSALHLAVAMRGAAAASVRFNSNAGVAGKLRGFSIFATGNLKGQRMAGPISPITISAELSLPEINQLVVQQESLLGPLVTVGNDAVVTLLFFDFTQDPPDNHAIVSVDPVPGTISIASGKIFISGNLVDVVVYRPN